MTTTQTDKKKIQDYIHFYLGSYIQRADRIERIDYGLLVYTRDNNLWKHTKLILRPLDSITEEEAIEYGWDNSLAECDYKGGSFEHLKERLREKDYLWFTPDDFIFLLSKGFDLFHLIDDGIAIEKK